MNKTPEQLRQEAAKLLQQANEIERIGKQQQPASTQPKAEDQQAQPNPVTGFYPKKPKRRGFTPTQICGLPLTEEQLKKLK
jgi:hypothetical protein